jgi:3-hydroxybutyryl-CoA dehydrogenase
MSTAINTICVCGAGTMGSGIAQVCATAGYYTLLYELNEQVLESAKEKLHKDLQGLVDKGKITSEKKEAILQNIVFTNNLQECIADVVIEAIIEKPEIKIALFNQLAEINHSETIFATNTSSLSVSRIAAGVMNPSRVAGLHFFNPAPVMKLVEVVKGEQTLETVIETLTDLTRKLNKQPVVCRDAPGFIVNRVARPYYIESLRLAEAGIADFAMIDGLLENRGFKMGPFKLMDLIGNDINYAVSCSVYEQMNNPDRLKPSFLQKEKVEKGHLGKKTRKGYYEYGPLSPQGGT